jgi:rare lipoprotein A (peptidoglycan hydrolase)
MAVLAHRVVPGVLASVLLAGPALAAAPSSTRQHIHHATPKSHVATYRPMSRSHRFVAAKPRSPNRHTIAAMHAARHRSVSADISAIVHTTAFVDDSFATTRPHWSQTGIASWYGGGHWQGHMTSSGAAYDQDRLTAAHLTLPLGSHVRVTLVNSSRSVDVVITDRPGTHTRIIDLSRAAAAALGILDRGVAPVVLTRE